MSHSLAPIAFFAYKRPRLTLKTLETLKSCRLSGQSPLFIFCDGPKKSEDQAAVSEVRRLVKSQNWCATVEVIEQSENQGLGKSIRTGVSQLVEKFGKVIVLEDDLILHPSFLEFMNKALDYYKDSKEVMQVSGYNYPVQIKNNDDAFLICHSSCWGWATWKRSWEKFDASPTFFEHLQKNPSLIHEFDMEDSYGYFDTLKKQFQGEVDSWGILWYQTIFQNQGLVLFPNETLVVNQGIGVDSTHYGSKGYPDVMGTKEVRILPKVERNRLAEKTIANYLRKRKSKRKQIVQFFKGLVGA